MKKLIVIGIVAMMVMGLAAAASAAEFVPDDSIKMGLTFARGTVSQGTLTIGTLPGALDGVDPNDVQYPGPVGTAGEIDSILLGGRYQFDYHAPVITQGACSVWNLKAYFNDAAVAGVATLKAWITASGKIDSEDYTVQLFSGTWTCENVKNAGTALWTAPLALSGTSTKPQFTLGGIDVAAGQSLYYTVAITTSGGEPIVPEPGSMVALFSGLVGLVGFGIRRRK